MPGLFKEIDGNLISLALDGEFDVIAHGCNCFCNMGAGIAVAMAETFDCSKNVLEGIQYKGDFDKLGRVEWKYAFTSIGEPPLITLSSKISKVPPKGYKPLAVVNAYSQYYPGPDLYYSALELAIKKMNHIFKGRHIGLPLIGCGLAGGSWEVVRDIIYNNTNDCAVTIVHYKTP